MQRRTIPPPLGDPAPGPLPDPEELPRRSIRQRIARGRALAAAVPADEHARWSAPAHREDPIAILQRQAATRVAELVPLRHGRMAVSPFAFFRGAAAIMAADLAGTATAGLRAQLCGDAHLLNFGIFDTPERTLLFGLNDFDETIPGPIEWDLKRLVVSVELAGRELGLTAHQCGRAVRSAACAYREAMAEFAELRALDLWYSHLPAVDLLDELESLGHTETRHEAKRRLRQAMRRDHTLAFERLVDASANPPRFRSDPPLLVPVEELLAGPERERYIEVMQAFLGQYRGSLQPDRRRLMAQYRFAHIARKVVGVGSVGTRAWVVLMMGARDDDPLVLQLKEAQPSVLAPYVGGTTYESEGHRVVEGQRLMQAASDPMLGWYRLVAFDGVRRDFYVRQLWDGKASIDVSRLSAKGLRRYVRRCGWTLARGHARSGDRIAAAAYLGDGDALDRALEHFAAAYADQTEQDHARLLEAIDRGELDAVGG